MTAVGRPLESIEGLILHNVAAAPVTLDGRKGLRLTMSDEARREQRQVEQLAKIRDLEFSNGVIEVELAGAPAKGAVALWLDAGTIAHFRNLSVTPDK
jgi:hypothetical protein